MNIRINKRENPFVQIDKIPVNDRRLSPAALGVLTYLLSKPDGWKAKKEELLVRFSGTKIKTTINMIEAIFRELRETGYAKLVPVKGEGGKVIGSEYIISELPNLLAEPATSSGIGDETDLATSSDLGTSSTVGNVATYSNNDFNSNNEVNLIGKKEAPKSKKASNQTFQPPTIPDLKAHFKTKFVAEKIANAESWADWEAAKFFDFYTANQWHVGKRKMKSWTIAATGWANRAIENGLATKTLPAKYTQAQPAGMPFQKVLNLNHKY